ncbi:hypothetical protein ACDL38_10445, partial [Corynebacterium diphtheriae]
KPAPPAGDANTNVVTGTVRVMNAVEYMQTHNIPFLSSTWETESDYVATLVLDQPTAVSGKKAGQLITQTVKEISLGAKMSRYSYGEEWFALEGQHMTLSSPVSESGFASGTGLPGGVSFDNPTRL